MKWNKRELKWLAEGRDRFAMEGVSGLDIGKMSHSIGTAKTSFYHFFKTRDLFFKELLDFWVLEAFEKVVTKIPKDVDATQRLMNLINLALDNVVNDQFLIQLTTYSFMNPLVSVYLDKVEEYRKTWIKQLFLDGGYNEKDAEVKTDFLYTFYLGIVVKHKFDRPKGQARKRLIKDIMQAVV